MDQQLLEPGAERVSFGGLEGAARLRHHADPGEVLAVAWTYREADMCDAMTFYLRQRRRRTRGLRAFFWAVLLMDLLLLGPDLVAILILWVALSAWLMRTWLTRWYPQRLVRAERAFAGEHRWEVSEDGVFMTRPHAETRLGWAAVARVCESPEGFLLFPQNNHFCYLPKRTFDSPEAIEEMRDLCRRHTQFEGEPQR